MVKLVGLDLGTSGVRYECYGLNGDVLASGRSQIKEQTTEQWTRSLRLAVPKKRGFKVSEELLLSAQSTSGTVLLLDACGSDVFRPLMYHEKDLQGFRKMEGLESAIELSKRGVSISPTSPVSKIVGIKDRHPREFEKVRWIVSPTMWLLYKVGLRAARFPKHGSDTVDTVAFDEERGHVQINREQYFSDVNRDSWTYEIGGYAVLERWLKERTEHQLTPAEIEHYSKMIGAIKMTLETQEHIDALFDQVLEHPLRIAPPREERL